ncbi:SusC/RagA family TonB-linked outer membrane protein [Pedobacter ginsenosidimutans]|uniref:SusC/RagA family TonB-linked outer membrane protein n=1 Tax=Pedobacter ginsenosidimutans TaxID=687842 RepID=A0A0T5VKY5_9SPHI|nr:SusC/RagA family TonB-linked outer membrane protein [Pedobacter ginsenosidimutans]KRT14507.1 SusC/RagA family TonB-linked outer membrane protein [Pedobacter ginsenosidimutans]
MYNYTKTVIKGILPCLLFFALNNSLLAQEKDSVSTTVIKFKRPTGPQVSGVVIGASSKKPLPGISVSVTGYAAALTDEKGNFKIGVPNYNAVLVISGQGYQSKEEALKGRKTISKIALFEERYVSVYDAAVLPFGTALKNRTPYSASTVNLNGSWERSNETPDSYLQGKIAGLEVLRRSGTPDIGADLYLRGYNSLYAANQPLIVVDGVIYDVNTYGSSIIAGHQNNRLANIDLKDIDNITLIKDGASVYGTKGANGVLMITTGRAKDVATRLDFSAYGGYNGTVSLLPVMEADNYRIFLSDLLKTKPGMTDALIKAEPYMNDNPNPAYYNYHQNINWQDQVMSSGISQNYYLKVTGGDDIATYALSLGYLNNDGLTDSTNLTRYQTRFNANLNLSAKLKSQVNLAFTRSEQNLRDQGQAYATNPLYLALVKAPFLSPFELSETGVQSPNLADTDIFGTSNPSAAIKNIQALNRSYRFSGSVGFNYEFNKTFKANALVGITYDKVRENYFTPMLGIAPVLLPTAVGYNKAAAGVQRLFTVNTDTWVSYNKDLNEVSKLSANLGFRLQHSSAEVDNGASFNTASDDFVTLGGTQSTLRVVGGSLGKWNWLNNYFNVNYEAYNKYFVSFNIAADASSRFGKDIPDVLNFNGVKMALMPSVAASWLISSESFMANNNFIESLKLRASYGLTGNDDIGNYTAKSYYVSQNFLGRQGLVRGNIGNTALKWERNAKLNVGVDASFLKERLNISLDLYQNKISDMLIYEPLLTSTGFSYAVSNGGSMSNSGLELSINGRLINQTDLKWDMGLTYSLNRNKISQLGGNDQLLTQYSGATIITQIGDAANLFYGYKSNGVYTSAAEAVASGLSNKTADGAFIPFQGGDMKFADLNGDKVIDERDRQVIGNPNPDFVGAYSNKLSYKRWSLDALFTFSYGNEIYNSTRAILENMNGYNNQSPAAVNRWRVDGQATDVPRASWGDPSRNSRFSDRWIEDGSYLKLRTISLSYNVPIKASFIRSATVYAIANNVFTVTNYLGYDPEFSAGSSVFARGVDIGLEPSFRSMFLGVRIGL